MHRHAFAMNTFLTPVELLTSGFTGIAALMESIAALFGVRMSTSVGMLLLSISVWHRHIGKNPYC